MQDLNILLVRAGVAPVSPLENADSVSNNGNYIAADGVDGNGYLVYYNNGLAGVSTPGARAASASRLGKSMESGQIASHSLPDVLLGVVQPVTQDSTLYGGDMFGSELGFAGGQYSKEAFTVLGGVAYGDQEFPNMSFHSASTVALAVRGALGADTHFPLMPYAELGGWVTPDAGTTFQRDYADGAGIAGGQGDTTTTQWLVYAKLGIAWNLGAADQLNGLGQYGRQYIRFDGYTESTGSNPFPPTVDGGLGRMDIGEVGLSWSHKLTERFSVTTMGALAHSFAVNPDINIVVTPFGAYSASGEDYSWAELGIRLDTKLTDRFSLGLGAVGTGGGGIETAAHGIASVNYTF